ncbi:MAG: NAD-dependent epimerase/dehydratase family protein [Balneolaceae bacterium]
MVEKKKVFITGVTGFVGGNLMPYLKEHISFDMEGVVRDKKADGLENLKSLFTWDELSAELTPAHYIHLAGKAHDVKGVSNEQEYFDVNVGLTKRLFDHFVQNPESETFIFMSSVKAVSDSPDGVLTEDETPNPVTAYGRSKLKAEEYILEHCPPGKNVYILRPCMIHGPGNKGNLNLLYKIISKGIPWPLGRFDNLRSFLSIENLCFIVHQILKGTVKPGVYHIADSEPLSTHELIQFIAESSGRKSRIINTPKGIIKFMAKLGNLLPLPLDEERLQKLTEDYVVSNRKLVEALGEELPVSEVDGMRRTIKAQGGPRSIPKASSGLEKTPAREH